MSSGVIEAQPTSQQHLDSDDEYEDDFDDGPCCSCYCCKMVCKMFCCPPIPSIIVSKQAFLPPPVSYEFEVDPTNDGKLRLRVEGKVIDLASRGLETNCIILETKGRNQIGAYLLKLPNPRYTILFSHGNAVDIGQMFPFMVQLAQSTRCSVLAYDYAGYGISTGKTREKNQYDDIDAVWKYLTETEGMVGDHIILYGQSIGSSPSVHKARKLSKPRRDPLGPQPLGGLVLHSPLMSGIRVLRPECQTTLCCDPFKNINKITSVTAPTLVVHGVRDDVVPVIHGQTLDRLAPNSVEALFLPDANHNNIELFPEYLGRLVSFCDELDAMRFSLTDR
eukprot:m.100547 g.100547  ORF g.100547 m.100547 type:complete len:335 (+) comp27253_c1_seq1:36-1040(+)